MDWQSFAAVGSVLATIVLGILTFTRGVKSDQALNMATNVQTVYLAQQSLIDDLRLEVERLRGMWKECEGQSAELRDRVRKLENSLD